MFRRCGGVMGEYQALMPALRAAAKGPCRPLYHHSGSRIRFRVHWQPKKTVQEHVHPFAARYQKPSGASGPAWVGVHPRYCPTSAMGDGRDILHLRVRSPAGSSRRMPMPAVPP